MNSTSSIVETKAALASFKFKCFNPIKPIGSGLKALKSSMYLSSCCSSAGENTPLLINSRKHRVVASTSAVALCASAKSCANKCL